MYFLLHLLASLVMNVYNYNPSSIFTVSSAFRGRYSLLPTREKIGPFVALLKVKYLVLLIKEKYACDETILPKICVNKCSIVLGTR